MPYLVKPCECCEKDELLWWSPKCFMELKISRKLLDGSIDYVWKSWREAEKVQRRKRKTDLERLNIWMRFPESNRRSKRRPSVQDNNENSNINKSTIAGGHEQTNTIMNRCRFGFWYAALLRLPCVNPNPKMEISLSVHRIIGSIVAANLLRGLRGFLDFRIFAGKRVWKFFLRQQLSLSAGLCAASSSDV